MPFGLNPHWAKERMNLTTARAEGDRNKSNDQNYFGPNSIFLKPAFMKPLQHYRCLVVADGFTWQNGNKTIYVSTIEQPSVFAGIYDYWKDPATGLVTPGFSVITVPSTGILRSAGILRMPLVLSFFNCTNWIKHPMPLNYYLPMLDRSRIEIANSFVIGNSIQAEPKQPAITESRPLPKRHYGRKREFEGIEWGARVSQTKL